MKADHLGAVFAALAHEDRRRILDILKEHPGSSVGEVASFFETSRVNVLKHLRVLGGARLVLSRKNGRRRELYFNVVPIQEIHERWTTEYSALWASKLTRIKYAVEAGASDE
jgi:DNA-binding transcriptional ArsR family regulator